MGRKFCTGDRGPKASALLASWIICHCVDKWTVNLLLVASYLSPKTLARWSSHLKHQSKFPLYHIVSSLVSDTREFDVTANESHLLPSHFDTFCAMFTNVRRQ